MPADQLMGGDLGHRERPPEHLALVKPQGKRDGVVGLSASAQQSRPPSGWRAPPAC
jgi:hypothetical protein